MKRRPFAFLAALCVSAGAAFTSEAAPPSDAQIEAAITTFSEKEKAAAELAGQAGKGGQGGQGSPVKATDRIRFADDALEGMDLTALTPAQVKKLMKAGLVPMASKSKAIAEHLGDLARADTVEGADAAALRLGFMRFEPDPSAQQQMVRRALTHPQLKTALMEGKATSLFPNVRGARKELLPELLALKDILSTDMPPETAALAYMSVDAVIAITGDDDAQAREPLRVKTLEMVRAAQKAEIADDSLRASLAYAEKKLDGPFMRGKLVGHPAPDLTVTWTNMEPPIKSLFDLRGKVVVLDFWATWCGPCIASFPDVKKLQAHYEGYPVVILGVTSLQGLHVSGPKTGPDGILIAESRSIDCKDDPKKEMDLMSEFIKDREISWKIAFTKENVYNSDYGIDAGVINGIPHVVIIDAKGIVRHRKLHPNSKATPLTDKIAKIDALLRESGLPTPPPPQPERTAAPKGG